MGRLSYALAALAASLGGATCSTGPRPRPGGSGLDTLRSTSCGDLEMGCFRGEERGKVNGQWLARRGKRKAHVPADRRVTVHM